MRTSTISTNMRYTYKNWHHQTKHCDIHKKCKHLAFKQTYITKVNIRLPNKLKDYLCCNGVNS